MDQFMTYVSDRALRLMPDNISNGIQRALENSGTIIQYNGSFYHPLDIIPYKINDREYEAFSYGFNKRIFTLYDLKKPVGFNVVSTINNVDLIDVLKTYKMIIDFKEDDGIWARYFRDGFTLSAIAEEYKCDISDLEFLVDCQHRIIDAGIKSNKLLKGVL